MTESFSPSTSVYANIFGKFSKIKNKFVNIKELIKKCKIKNNDGYQILEYIFMNQHGNLNTY